MNRIFIRILHIATIVIATSGHAEAYSGGNGSEENPYLLSNMQDLLELAVNADDYDKHFELTSSIDLSGEVFTNSVIAPDISAMELDHQGDTFVGVLNGSGYSISNLYIDASSTSNSYLGLVGYMSSNAVVSDLTIAGCYVSAGNHAKYIGGLAGQCDGLLERCSSSGTIIGGEDVRQVGLLCGRVGRVSGVASNCFSTGEIETASLSKAIGGLCGSLCWGARLVDCWSDAAVC